MSHPTCSACAMFQQFYGERQGACWGFPPAMFPSGAHTNSPTPPPKVLTTRPACAFFKPIQQGDTPLMKSKVSPETPGDAIKLARQEHAPLAAIATPTKATTPITTELPSQVQPKPQPRRRQSF